MEEYYKWQIEQLQKMVAQQDKLIQSLCEQLSAALTEDNR